MQSQTNEKVLLTDVEVAAMLNLSRTSVWRHFKAGRLPQPMKVFGATRWLRSEVLEFIDSAAATRGATK